MAIRQETKRNERIRQLAKGYYGDHLIGWLKEIRIAYSDVVNAKKLGLDMDTAVAVSKILEEELILPLESWRIEEKPRHDTGEDSE